MKVVVTGATGFIGSALCVELLNAGHTVAAVVRPNSSRKDNLPYGVNVIGLPLSRLNELKGQYDLFYHLAWNGADGEKRNDFEIQQKNIKYTVEAIRAAKRCGCGKFVGAGSQAEYGVVKNACIEETTPQPFMMYGVMKLSAYYIGKIIADQECISFVWPRIYSVYGPNQNTGTLLSYLFHALKKGEVPQLSSCENLWDYMYVTDCTYALRLLGEKKEAKGIYNVSAGEVRFLKDYVKEVRDLIAPNISLNFNARKNDENKTFCLYPNISKLKKLGFERKISFLQGIKKIMEIEKRN